MLPRSVFGIFIGVVGIATTGTTNLAYANLLYGSSNDTPDSLFTMDQNSGAATLVGGIGFSGVSDLTSDWRSSSFRLWANDFSTNQLISIDPATGTGVSVGNFGTPAIMASIAFDVVTGKLFGATTDNALHEINPANASSTFIGPTGFGSIHALGFDLSGTLYGFAVDTNQLISINTTTGVGTAIAFADSFAIVDLAARPSDGVMFAVDSRTDTMRTIDLASGQTTSVGPYGAGVNFMNGLAFSPVPEPANATVLSLGLLLLAARRVFDR